MSLSGEIPSRGRARSQIGIADPQNESARGRITRSPLPHPPERDERERDEADEHVSLPWWKRPSLAWVLLALPLPSLAAAITFAPRVEVYTILACRVHKPEYSEGSWKRLTPTHVDSHLSLKSSLDFGTASIPFDFMHTNLREDHVYVDNIPEARFDPGDNKNTDRCASDTEVQAAVAKLSAVISVVRGVLSSLTAGWWGSFSDRHGRTRVMGIFVIGALVTDFVFILVFLFSTELPGGYWFLVTAPVVEGCLGGMFTSGVQAYVSDVSDVRNRSRDFSLFMGVYNTGLTVGPALGGLLIRGTGDVMSAFYAATVLHLVYAILVCCLVPESVTRKKMIASRIRYQEQLKKFEIRDEGTTGYLARFKQMLWFLEPLAVFVPKHIESPMLSRRTRDWNLMWVAFAYGLTILIVGANPTIYQYALATYGWSSETLSYYLSSSGIARMIYLTFILPVVIKLLRRQQPIQLSSVTIEHQTSILDLKLAQISVLIDAAAYVLMALAPTGTFFTLSTMVGSLGQGFLPATQSVALELYAMAGEEDTGRLLGALSVVNILSSQIISPAIYGLIYIATVAVFPSAVFFVSMGAVVGSFLFLCLIRLPGEPCKGSNGDETSFISDEEGCLIDTPHPEIQSPPNAIR